MVCPIKGSASMDGVLSRLLGYNGEEVRRYLRKLHAEELGQCSLLSCIGRTIDYDDQMNGTV